MSSHSSNIEAPSNKKYTWGGVGVVAIVALIGGLAMFLYFINAPKPINSEIVSERKARLAEVNAKQNELISTYAWIDQSKGVVRIPIERAMQITVEELRHPNTAKKEEASNEVSEGKENSNSEK
ncbi:MAG: hypothetical protein C5B43_00790 [Verrucomicrobia bacterium]|nr:MAG: hypothetical protein C5B43_00790 [Verrucomicrobiota bacterium]